MEADMGADMGTDMGADICEADRSMEADSVHKLTRGWPWS